MKTIFFLALAVLGMAMTSCKQTKSVRAIDNDGTTITVKLDRHSPLVAGDTVQVFHANYDWEVCGECTIDVGRRVVIQGDK